MVTSSEILTNCNLTGDEAEAKIVALFGITLGMGITCLIPVSFAVLGCSAYENFHNDLSYKKSLLEGGLPSLIGGIIIWICFLLA